jgi:hypothetical protein
MMVLEMKAGGFFETFYVCIRLEGLTMHKTLCFILCIIVLDRRTLGTAARHIASYLIYVMFSHRITGITEKEIRFMHFFISV